MEGRLRIADKERQRRVARQQAAATGAGADAGGGSGGGGGRKEDLQQAAEAADAVMAELLEAEEADKVCCVGLLWVGGGGILCQEPRVPVLVPLSAVTPGTCPHNPLTTHPI